jgi:multiple sugar transport system substrate-binding protein
LRLAVSEQTIDVLTDNRLELMMTRHRTEAVSILAASVAAILLAGCGGADTPSGPGTSGGGSSPGASEPVTLRFVWWGNDTRNELTEKAIDLYESKHSNITIETETSDFAGYWQKLSTQVAGGDAPDIIQMDEKYLAEYADKGALADLEVMGLDTADWANGTVDAGRFDGKLYAATFAVNSPVLLANQSLFEKAGVALPDDKTWTWESAAALAVDLQSKANGDFYGMENLIGVDGATKIWIRQQGEQQFTDDGIGFDSDTAASWFEYWKKLQDDGGTAPATATIENQATALDQNLTATNRAAIGFQWSNQVNAIQSAAGQEFMLLRPPTDTGKAADSKLWYKSSMYLSASASTEHAVEVSDFINFLINDPEAGAILGTERGVPTNLQVRAAIASSLDEANKKVVDFMEAIAGELGAGGSVPLPGGGQSETIQRRATDQVLLGDIQPAAAAKQFVTELKAEMGLS